MLTERIARLQRVVSVDPDRQKIASVFESEIWGRRWLCGTNGHVLAALEYDGPAARTDGPQASAVVPPEWKPTHVASLAALRRWAGRELELECEECYGTGYITAHACECPHCAGQHDCGECDKTGKVTPPRWAPILAVVMNRNLLARALESAPEVERVELVSATEKDPLVLRAGDWLAVVMPCNPGTADHSAALAGPDRFSALEAA